MSAKPIRFSNHARKRLESRGANDAEVVIAIQNETWQPALKGKWQVRKKFD